MKAVIIALLLSSSVAAVGQLTKSDLTVLDRINKIHRTS